MTRRTLWWVLAAVAALLLSNWFSRQADEERGREERARRHVPDYFLTDFTATTMGPEGQPDYRLQAERLVHYPDTDTAELTEPRIVVFQATENDWYARAESGRVGPGGEVVYLNGNVEIHQPGRAGEPPLKLVTEHLAIHPQDDYAETDAPVTLTGPDSRVDGLGMRAYLKQERIELLSEVYGTHEPTNR